MKLEIKHLAPYLPYGLKVQTEHIEGDRVYALEGLSKKYDRVDLDDDYGWSYIGGIKPILRPLSDFNKEININGDNITPNHDPYFKIFIQYELDQFMAEPRNNCSLSQYEKLLEWHFDVFGLIKKGLAVDKNTLDD